MRHQSLRLDALKRSWKVQRTICAASEIDSIHLHVHLKDSEKMTPITAIVIRYIYIYIWYIYIYNIYDIYVIYLLYDDIPMTIVILLTTSQQVSTSMAMVPTPPMGSKTTLPSSLMAPSNRVGCLKCRRGSKSLIQSTSTGSHSTTRGLFAKIMALAVNSIHSNI